MGEKREEREEKLRSDANVYVFFFAEFGVLRSIDGR